jgi:hypothetical protein
MALLRRLHIAHPAVAKILLLESFDRDPVVNSFRSGARGLFCFTESFFRSLCRCIQAVQSGQVGANAEQIDYLIELVNQVPSLRVVNARGDCLLTPREEQVVALVAEGLSNRKLRRNSLSVSTPSRNIYSGSSTNWASRPGSNWCSTLLATATIALPNGCRRCQGRNRYRTITVKVTRNSLLVCLQ